MPKIRNIYEEFIDSRGVRRLSLADKYVKFCGCLPWLAETDECILWNGTRYKNDYGMLVFKPPIMEFLNIQVRTIGTHRLCYIIANGGLWLPRNMFVCHDCDNPPCCNINHLRKDSQKGNLADMYAKGRQNQHFGENCHSAKLKQEQADEMRRYYATGNYTQESLAEFYGVSRGAVWQIVTGKSY